MKKKMPVPKALAFQNYVIQKDLIREVNRRETE